MLTMIDLVAGRPWAIRPDIAAHIHGLLIHDGIAGLRHLAGLKHDIHAHDGPQLARGRARAQNVSTVAVVPVIGTLTQRVELVGSAETRSTVDIVGELQEAVADPKVDAAVLEFDSPGGEVFGVPEAWQAIREARKAKPVVAAVNSMAGSAAYYLASAATEMWVTPSGTVGSIGVFALHVDRSKALEEKGEAWEFIVAQDSPFKVEGNPTGPLSDDARAELQGDIDRYMGMFVRDLAKGRGVSRDTVRELFGRGRLKGPEAAMAIGMIDEIGTLSDAIRRAGQLGQERRTPASSQATAGAFPAGQNVEAKIELSEAEGEALETLRRELVAEEEAAEARAEQEAASRRLWESV